MSAKKGFALIAVLAVMIVLGIATVAVLQAAFNISKMKAEYQPELNAQYIAEAGLQHILYECRTAGNCDAVTYDAANPLVIEGCDVTLTKTPGAGSYAGLTQLDVEAVCP